MFRRAGRGHTGSLPSDPEVPLTSAPTEPVPHLHVAVIGSGFSGLGAATLLTRRGETDFLVFERAAGLGGTWRDNTYPGAACDIPSHLYSFSFAPKPDWSRVYAPQAEILAYLRSLVDRFGLAAHLRFGHELLEATWDDAEARWQIVTSRGRWTADLIVSGHGPLVEPRWPELPGLERFQGAVMHSARWDHSLDLRGRRVAVVGSGASAVQFVPEVARVAGHLSVFQRTAPWVVPRGDRAVSLRAQALFRRLPLAQRLARQLIFARQELNYLGFVHPVVARVAARLARAHLAAQVPDPALRARLTPHYAMGCKRILVSDEYYPALQLANVELVTGPITEVQPDALLTADGRRHRADVLICGTGFHVSPPPIAARFRGRGGRTLAEVWQGGAQAYLGTTVAGFPNLFLLVGPNTALGHNSVVYMIEAQLAYLMGALEHLRRNHLLALEVRPEVQAADQRALRAVMRESVWLRGGCTSFYLDAHGQNTTLWPGFASAFRRRLRRFDPSAYSVRLSPTPLPQLERSLRGP